MKFRVTLKVRSTGYSVPSILTITSTVDCEMEVSAPKALESHCTKRPTKPIAMAQRAVFL